MRHKIGQNAVFAILALIAALAYLSQHWLLSLFSSFLTLAIVFYEKEIDEYLTGV